MATSPALSDSSAPVEPRVLVVIGQVLGEPWLDIALRGQLQTWVPWAQASGLEIRHSYGKPPGPILRQVDALHENVRWSRWGRKVVPKLDSVWGRPLSRWKQDVSVADFGGIDNVGWKHRLPDLYMFQRWKLLGSFRQSLLEDFDFVYFTTASSYVSPEVLVEFASMLPRTRLYAGTRMVDHDTGLTFGSGANRFMSRDVVQMVVAHSSEYRNDVMEDVGLGRLLCQLGIEVVPVPSTNVQTFAEIDGLSDSAIRENFHFRLKSGTRKNRRDVSLMHALHRRITHQWGM